MWLLFRDDGYDPENHENSYLSTRHIDIPLKPNSWSEFMATETLKSQIIDKKLYRDYRMSGKSLLKFLFASPQCL